MKKCRYCAKEIGYNDYFCSQECENSAENFFRVRSKVQKILSAVNIGGTVLIAVGIFLYALTNVIGAFMVAAGGLSLGVITMFLPSPPDNFIDKFKIKKASLIVRIFGIVLLAFGIAALILGIIKL
ncbi:MAG: DUF2116 family Zn-ribbon domain-containing protein [Ruminococcus sp.]|nr:DUF2116 family Zn-ribbon domain-containing protein [Ruminococcus sp.]